MGNTLEGIKAVVKDNEEAVQLLGEQVDMCDGTYKIHG